MEKKKEGEFTNIKKIFLNLSEKNNNLEIPFGAYILPRLFWRDGKMYITCYYNCYEKNQERIEFFLVKEKIHHYPDGSCSKNHTDLSDLNLTDYSFFDNFTIHEDSEALDYQVFIKRKKPLV